jgi:lipopolysaccharide export system protein LptA
VKISRCSRGARCRWFLVLVILATAGAPASGNPNQPPPVGAPGPAPRRIDFSSDTLIADRTAQTAEFVGNVKISRGSDVITADRLIVTYDRKQPPAETGVGAKSAIRKAVATGNVRIATGNMTATAQRAVYTQDSQTIVLSGENARVTSGNNSVAGTTITLYIDHEQITVTGDGGHRVRALFNAPKK